MTLFNFSLRGSSLLNGSLSIYDDSLVIMLTKRSLLASFMVFSLLFGWFSPDKPPEDNAIDDEDDRGNK